MANEKNLVSFKDMTPSQQRKIQSAGGKASQKKRRERKKMREQAEMLLSLPFQDIEITDENGNVKSMLEEMQRISGVKDAGEFDNQMAMLVAMWKQVLSGGASAVQAFNSLRELVGEKQTDIKLDGGVTVNFDGEKDIED